MGYMGNGVHTLCGINLFDFFVQKMVKFCKKLSLYPKMSVLNDLVMLSNVS